MLSRLIKISEGLISFYEVDPETCRSVSSVGYRGGFLWVVKAWRSEDVALYGKVVSPPSPNSQ